MHANSVIDRHIVLLIEFAGQLLSFLQSKTSKQFGLVPFKFLSLVLTFLNLGPSGSQTLNHHESLVSVAEMKWVHENSLSLFT